MRRNASFPRRAFVDLRQPNIARVVGQAMLVHGPPDDAAIDAIDVEPALAESQDAVEASCFADGRRHERYSETE